MCKLGSPNQRTQPYHRRPTSSSLRLAGWRYFVEIWSWLPAWESLSSHLLPDGWFRFARQCCQSLDSATASSSCTWSPCLCPASSWGSPSFLDRSWYSLRSLTVPSIRAKSLSPNNETLGLSSSPVASFSVMPRAWKAAVFRRRTTSACKYRIY